MRLFTLIETKTLFLRNHSIALARPPTIMWFRNKIPRDCPLVCHTPESCWLEFETQTESIRAITERGKSTPMKRSIDGWSAELGAFQRRMILKITINCHSLYDSLSAQSARQEKTDNLCFACPGVLASSFPYTNRAAVAHWLQLKSILTFGYFSPSLFCAFSRIQAPSDRGY